ncbi:MAG: DUF4954 family protein [Bacteroidaceae bacterium]|nr:DUF4954 family protein [Bacteroidaceae bacterium]
MRQLSNDEVIVLESQRCWAEDWSAVKVADGFDASAVRNTNFYGRVEIGEHCRISDVRILRGSGKKDMPKVISVLNEGGDGNVVLCPELTAQLAWMMIHYHDIFMMVYEQHYHGDKGRCCRVGDYCVIEGATKLEDCDIHGCEGAVTYIGPDVIMEKVVTACGAEITDGAKVYDSFVGEAVHIGRGFVSESSLFFANTYMDNGEACAALCGPFTCSHHKSTLLIGGQYSFYNAGSNTNQSNHAYKMGPIHWGTLERGVKTASGCHILWPATIGMFSMVMGKLTQHPDLSRLPFSYVMASQDRTYVVPGVNIKTVGIWRDITKWPRRDSRKEVASNDIITFDFPNPLILQSVKKGKELLERLVAEQGECEEYHYQKCLIKKNALDNGIRYYELIEALCDCEWADKEYVDMLGFVVERKDIDTVVRRVNSGFVNDSAALVAAISALRRGYPVRNIDQKAYLRWIDMVKADAKKEYNMGDVSEEQLDEFISGVRWRTAVQLYKNQ